RLAAHLERGIGQPQGSARVPPTADVPPRHERACSVGDRGGLAMAEAVRIYTDGACSQNPGPGGWGAILIYGAHRRELSGGEALTTNNRMELMAAIAALEALKKPVRVDLHTDSEYVRNGISQWMEGWKRRGWKTAANEPVKNVELWQRLDSVAARHQVRWHW